jgi:hypothetical protein
MRQCANLLMCQCENVSIKRLANSKRSKILSFDSPDTIRDVSMMVLKRLEFKKPRRGDNIIALKRFVDPNPEGVTLKIIIKNNLHN